MFGNPFSNLYSSYYDPADYYSGDPYNARPSFAQRRALAQQQALERERAQRRAESLQRAKYLPDEDIDDDDDDWVYRDALQRRRAYERRQQEEKIINQRREEQERLEKLARQEEERRRESLRQAHRLRQSQNRSYRPPSPTISRSQSPAEQHQTSASFQRSPSPPAELYQSKHTLEEQNEAATRIQTAFRIHSALGTLKTLESQFDTLRNSFTFPTTIDFQSPQGIVSVSVPPSLPEEASDIDTPKLAYNQTNYTLHSYTESLNRLLIKLDGVESWGNSTVRKSRRRIVGRVEAEASRVETYWKQSWAAYIASHTQQ